MKAHGITGNTGGGGGGGKSPSAAGSGPSTPKTPKTTASRKALPNSSSKKRKLAASSDDVDDDIIKNEVKNEVKHEEEDSGSYTMHPTDPRFDAAMENFVKVCGGTLGGDTHGVEDKVLFASASRRDLGGAPAVPVAAPVALVQQMFLPHAPDTFYGFVDHHPSDLRQQSPSHAVLAATRVPVHLDQDTDCFRQMRVTSEHSTAQWLHQQSFYWNGEQPAESEGNLGWNL